MATLSPKLTAPVIMSISPALSVTFDPSGVVEFRFSDASVTRFESSTYMVKAKSLDQIALVGDVYSPVDDATYLMDNGMSEVAAVSAVMLRLTMLCARKHSIANKAVVEADKLKAMLEVKASSVATLARASSFFVAALPWLSLYIGRRVDGKFDKNESRLDAIAPWVFEAFAISGFSTALDQLLPWIEKEMLCCFDLTELTVMFARTIMAPQATYVPGLLVKAIKNIDAIIPSQILVIWSLIDVLTSKTDVGKILPEFKAVAAKYQLAYESLISLVYDRRPKVANLAQIVHEERLRMADGIISVLLGMCKVSEKKVLAKYAAILIEMERASWTIDTAAAKPIWKEIHHARPNDTMKKAHGFLSDVNQLVVKNWV
jgi:hypothetical protein